MHHGTVYFLIPHLHDSLVIMAVSVKLVLQDPAAFAHLIWCVNLRVL
jgi:hypothetical protein